ncbi:MAG: glycoside hydrolase family 26 protein [Vulcanimicrobiota bacterium]
MKNKVFIISSIIAGIVIAVFVIHMKSYSSEPFFWGAAIDGYPVSAEKLREIEEISGIHPEFVVFFLQWPAEADMKNAQFPESSLDCIWNSGAVPVLTWEPMVVQAGKETAVPCEKITGGAYDQYITSFARGAGRWGKPCMIRFGHEMNIERYHWGTDKSEFGPRSPQIYRDMFRYVVSIFRKEGVKNVKWVFCPNAESVPNTSYDPSAAWNLISKYYPGNDFVDILGIDGYNYGFTQTKEKNGWESTWKSFREIFEKPYHEQSSLSHDKPVFIFETACVKEGGSRETWLKDALAASGEWKISGIFWFQENKENDWRITCREDQGMVDMIRKELSRSQRWIKDL